MDSQRTNFILGRGEKLTGPIEHVSAPVEKVDPYTIDEAEELLRPQFQEAVRQLDELPDLACPNNQTVFAVTLHPEYIAKSYYPEQLIQELGGTEIGSRATMIKPKKWAKKRAPEAVRSVTLFLRGSRDDFREVPSKLQSTDAFGKATHDLIKIEEVQPITSIERVRQSGTGKKKVRYEIVLHASADAEDGFIIDGFQKYIESIGLKIDINRRLFADGLCFMSMDASPNQAEEISSYSFVRVVREMPQLRPISRSGKLNFKITLPNTPPVNPDVKVAVFDSGVPAKSILDPWVRPFETPGIGPAVSGQEYHGGAVTGAVLFGPLSDSEPIATPYCYVDHYRVLDTNTGANGDDDLLDVLKRIQDVLEGTNYSFVNLSLGPNMTIEDDEPHAWSTILDRIFFEQDILAAIAVGNSGKSDRTSGLARVQPPSDCVNGTAVGAADSAGTKWDRAPYSSVGPGRAPGIVKPDIVAFGGSRGEPFNVVDVFTGEATPDAGTSFASPAALRTGIGVRAHFGTDLSPMAIKALLLHMADDGGHDRTDVGWGRVPLDFREMMSTDDHEVRVMFQGVLSPAETIKAPIPLPHNQLKGNVDISATVVYLAPTNPQDTANYTSAGLDIVFRPHADKKTKDPGRQVHPDTKSFFSKNDYELFDDPLSYKAHIWETARTNKITMRGTSLKDPAFNLHYNARDGVGNAGKNAQQIRYAMVITISAKNHPDLYNQVVNRYRALLEPLRPVIQVPVRA